MNTADFLKKFWNLGYCEYDAINKTLEDISS